MALHMRMRRATPSVYLKGRVERDQAKRLPIKKAAVGKRATKNSAHNYNVLPVNCEQD